MVEHNFHIALLPIGVTIGLISCMPLGPISLTLIATALRREMRKGFAIALAAALVEGIYAFIFISALNLLPASFRQRNTIELIGALIIVTYGISLLFTKNNTALTPDQRFPAPVHRDWILGGLTGVALAVSNPALVVFWISVAGILHSWISSTSSAANRAVFSGGVISGTISWFIMLLYIVRTTSARISLLMLRRLSIILSCALIGIGGYVLMKYLVGKW